MVTHWLIFIAGCWVGVTAGFGLAMVLMGPKLRRLDEAEDDFFGPTLAYRQSASAVKRQRAQAPGMPPANARPSHIA